VASIDAAATTGDVDLAVPGVDVVAARSSQALSQRTLRSVSWADTVVEFSRCSAAVFEGARFDRVVFRDCELSGVSFIDCSFRDCVVIGGKATSMLSVVDCAINGLWILDLNADRIEIQGGTIRALSIVDSSVGELVFNQPAGPKRSRGAVRLANLALGSVGGVTRLTEAGITVSVDAELWSLFGDLLLRQLGVEQLDPTGIAQLTG
jgi:hypothetical protein